mmetsp:Transcript_32905/g.61200  ORF Transcript_32905/g.61200 Transcript_32905/m.61200 type:complete len:320 (+) Transcript_32905:513-1472(+)
MVGEKALRFDDLDTVVEEFLGPPSVVVILVNEPLATHVLLGVGVGGHEFDEGTRNDRREELLGLVKHTPVLHEVFRETGRGGVGSLALHFGVDLTRDEGGAVDRGLGLREFLLKHEVDTVLTELRDAVRTVVRQAGASTSDGVEEENTVLVSVGLAEVLVELLGQVKRAVHVDVHNPVPFFDGEVHHHLARSVDTGVVDEDTKGLAGLGDSLGDGFPALFGTDVSDDANQLSLKSHFLGLSLSGFNFVLEGAHDQGRDATLEQAQGSGLSDTGATAGNDVELIVSDVTLARHHARHAWRIVAAGEGACNTAKHLFRIWI